MTEEKEWYTGKEFAEELGIPEHRVARLRREGRIKGITGGGKNTRYAMYHISELQKAKENPEILRDLRTKKKEDSAELAEENHQWYLRHPVPAYGVAV